MAVLPTCTNNPDILFSMRPSLVHTLLNLNLQFYDRYAASFSTSRYSIQPGIKRMLPQLCQAESILDVGCGNGNLSKSLRESHFTGTYLGLDSSAGLLGHAPFSSQYQFKTADLSDPAWSHSLQSSGFAVITCFAVLHHLPGRDLHSQVFQSFSKLLTSTGRIFLSVWQPLSSPRLLKRIIPWEALQIDPEQLDKQSDLLLDWRADDLKGPPAYRYVHQFRSSELDSIALSSGLTKIDEWLSDGREGNLALYQIWQKSS